MGKYFKHSDDLIKWQRSQNINGYLKNDISDDGLFDEMWASGWIDKTKKGWRVVTDKEIENGYWEKEEREVE